LLRFGLADFVAIAGSAIIAAIAAELIPKHA
jgi:hypothetical protein